MAEKGPTVIPKPFAVAVLTLVSLVWLVDFLAQFNFFVPGIDLHHQPSPVIQGTFLALVGGALIRAGWVARKALDEPPFPEGRPAPPDPTTPIETPPAETPPRTLHDGEHGGRHHYLLRRLRGTWA